MNTKEIAEKIYNRIKRYLQQPIGEDAETILRGLIKIELAEALSQSDKKMTEYEFTSTIEGAVNDFANDDITRKELFDLIMDTIIRVAKPKPQSDIHKEIERCIAECKKAIEQDQACHEIPMGSFNRLVGRLSAYEHLQSFQNNAEFTEEDMIAFGQWCWNDIENEDRAGTVELIKERLTQYKQQKRGE